MSLSRRSSGNPVAMRATLPLPGAARSVVPRSLCPFRDELCGECRCPTCCTGKSDLTPEEKVRRLDNLASDQRWRPEDQAWFRAAADALRRELTGDARRRPRRMAAPQTDGGLAVTAALACGALGLLIAGAMLWLLASEDGQDQQALRRSREILGGLPDARQQGSGSDLPWIGAPEAVKAMGPAGGHLYPASPAPLPGCPRVNCGGTLLTRVRDDVRYCTRCGGVFRPAESIFALAGIEEPQ